MNSLIGFVLAVALIFCGLLSSNVLPFSAHYGNAAEYKQFVHKVFADNELKIENGNLHFDGVIDSLIDTAANEKYGSNGYDIVIDTRSIDAYDDFKAICVHADGSEIDYEQYKELDEADRSGYSFKVEYTPNELILTDELLEKFDRFLSSAEENIRTEYEKVKAEKDGLSKSEYNEKVYGLYLDSYYPNLAIAAGAKIPRLRSYYYINYLEAKKTSRYLFVFDDLIFGEFATERGLDIPFYGVIERLTDGIIAADNADKFIISAVKGATPMIASSHFMTIIRMLPFILIIPIALALLMMLVFKLIHADDKQSKFLSCLKTEGSFLFVGSMLSALMNFIFGYAVSVSILNILPLIIFASVLFIRTAVHITFEFVSVSKQKAEPETKQ